MSDWIDVSVPIRNGMAQWPGDPRFHIERVSDVGKGDPATVSGITLSAHTGTHMDAPLHYLPNTDSIDLMPLDATIGPARVVQIRDTKQITREELMEYGLQVGERVLFKTANSDRGWLLTDEFHEDFVYIRRDAAEYLVDCGVRAVGIDYLSVGGFRQDGRETHEILLGAGVWIIEGIDLNGVEAGDYELVCLPLRLMGAEGAPARAILREISQ